jgi:SAM-dependent methyltransferase
MSINILYTDTFYESVTEGSRRSAEEVVPLIMELVNPVSVIDVGCGLGTWLFVFKGHGVNEILVVDGEYIDRDKLQIRPDEFISFDLKFLLQLGRTFDLVVSLEVAEHLPAECADTLIRTLTGLGDMVLFSAAIPFQIGVGHLNEQWPGYWVRLFQRQGFLAIDCLRERIWQNENVEPWYAQNMFFFVRDGRMENYPLLARQYKPAYPPRSFKDTPQDQAEKRRRHACPSATHGENF